jgi:hypothetical protein
MCSKPPTAKRALKDSGAAAGVPLDLTIDVTATERTHSPACQCASRPRTASEISRRSGLFAASAACFLSRLQDRDGKRTEIGKRSR